MLRYAQNICTHNPVMHCIQYFVVANYNLVRVCYMAHVNCGVYMAWTGEDIASVETAIMRLVSGARTARIKHGDEEIEFTQSSLDKLYSLRSRMLGEFASESRGSNVVRTKFVSRAF